jgi:hypothetical protein
MRASRLSPSYLPYQILNRRRSRLIGFMAIALWLNQGRETSFLIDQSAASYEGIGPAVSMTGFIHVSCTSAFSGT